MAIFALQSTVYPTGWNLRDSALWLAVVCLILSGCQDERGGVAVGNMNGVKLRIPDRYVLSRVMYSGEDIWNPQTISVKDHSYSDEIQSFDFFMKIDAQGVVSDDANREEFVNDLGKINPPYYSKWATVGVMRYKIRPRRDQMKIAFDSSRDSQMTKTLAREGVIFGLRFVLLHPNEKGYNSGFDSEYYDDRSRTWIACNREYRKVAPFSENSTCTEFFIDPNLNALVHIGFAKSRLAFWKSLHDRTVAQIDSFILRKPGVDGGVADAK